MGYTENGMGSSGRTCPVQVKGSRVHTVTLASRRRPVIEDMPQVCTTAGTEHFGPCHHSTIIILCADIQRRYRSKETGPAGAGMIFGCCIKEIGTATGAAIDTR